MKKHIKNNKHKHTTLPTNKSKGKMKSELKEPINKNKEGEGSGGIGIEGIKEIKQEEENLTISLTELLLIKEPLDVILMFFGFIAAIITGASIPTFNVLMGQLINEINDENTGFGSSITLLIHALLALAFINLCSGTIQVNIICLSLFIIILIF